MFTSPKTILFRLLDIYHILSDQEMGEEEFFVPPKTILHPNPNKKVTLFFPPPPPIFGNNYIRDYSFDGAKLPFWSLSRKYPIFTESTNII